MKNESLRAERKRLQRQLRDIKAVLFLRTEVDRHFQMLHHTAPVDDLDLEPKYQMVKPNHHKTNGVKAEW